MHPPPSFLCKNLSTIGNTFYYISSKLCCQCFYYALNILTLSSVSDLKKEKDKMKKILLYERRSIFLLNVMEAFPFASNKENNFVSSN